MTDYKQDDQRDRGDDQSLVMAITSRTSTSSVFHSRTITSNAGTTSALVAPALVALALSSSSASGPSGLPWGRPPPRESTSLTANTGQHMAAGITCCNLSTGPLAKASSCNFELFLQKLLMHVARWFSWTSAPRSGC